MKTIGIIPARYASTRFPAKALADIAGKPMIQRVYEQVLKTSSLDAVYVATDHEKIVKTVEDFGGKVILTSPETPTGTARCWEALQQIPEKFDFVINIQGDEPFIHPEQIDLVQNSLQVSNSQIATLAISIKETEELVNPNVVKVVFNLKNQAMYFSRYAIPFMRGIPENERLNHKKYFKHIGIYGFQTKVLEKIIKLPTSELEKAESLEQLCWLENSYTISIAETQHESYGIDTPEDLENILKIKNL